LSDSAPLPEEQVQRVQEDEMLQEALQQLNHEQQTVLFLRFRERRSHEEVASILGKSVDAVKMSSTAPCRLAAPALKEKRGTICEEAMAKHTLDAHSLAERLDTILPPGRFDTPLGYDDPLADLAIRLASAPQPEALGPEARARIRSQIVASCQAMLHPSFPRIPVNCGSSFSSAWSSSADRGAQAADCHILNRGDSRTVATDNAASYGDPTRSDTGVTPPTAPCRPPSSSSGAGHSRQCHYVFGTEVSPRQPLLTVLNRRRYPGRGITGTGRHDGDCRRKHRLVDVDVAVGASGQVWRDDGGCLNPPPDWAVARGWRRRCAAQEDGGGGSRGGS
jgi:hypothetical protein